MAFEDIIVIVIPFIGIGVMLYFLYRTKFIQSFVLFQKTNKEELEKSNFKEYFKLMLPFVKPFIDKYIDFFIGLAVRGFIYFWIFNIVLFFLKDDPTTAWVAIAAIVSARMALIGHGGKTTVLSPEEAKRIREGKATIQEFEKDA